MNNRKRMVKALAILFFSINKPYAMAMDCNIKKTCALNEYCSPFSERCEHCQNICDTTHHNFHESDCSKYCPNFGSDTSLTG